MWLNCVSASPNWDWHTGSCDGASSHLTSEELCFASCLESLVCARRLHTSLFGTSITEPEHRGNPTCTAAPVSAPSWFIQKWNVGVEKRVWEWHRGGLILFPSDLGCSQHELSKIVMEQYEQMTGKTPFNHQRLDSSSSSFLIKIISGEKHWKNRWNLNEWFFWNAFSHMTYFLLSSALMFVLVLPLNLSSIASSHKHTCSPFLPPKVFLLISPPPYPSLFPILQSKFLLLSTAIITSPHFVLTSEMIKRDHLFRTRSEKLAVRQFCAHICIWSLARGQVSPHGVCWAGWIFTY